MILILFFSFDGAQNVNVPETNGSETFSLNKYSIEREIVTIGFFPI
jgi:hypothetical protein